MRKAPSRRWLLGAVALLTSLTLGCALMQQPTPFVLPTATVAATVGDGGATNTPSGATTASPPSITASPTFTPSPNATDAPAAETPTPTIGATATPDAARVTFDPDETSTTLTTSLAPGAAHTYVLRISAGQLVDISADTDAPLQLEILGADGTVVKPLGAPAFRGIVPTTQDYFMTLTAQTAAANVILTLIIPVRITFAPGGTSAQLTATLPPFTTRHYVIRAQAGQTMTVDTTTTQGEVITIVFGADGAVLQTDHAGASDFVGALPTTQDYLIHLRSVGTAPASVTIDITIPPPD